MRGVPAVDAVWYERSGAAINVSVKSTSGENSSGMAAVLGRLREAIHSIRLNYSIEAMLAIYRLHREGGRVVVPQGLDNPAYRLAMGQSLIRLLGFDLATGRARPVMIYQDRSNQTNQTARIVSKRFGRRLLLTIEDHRYDPRPADHPLTLDLTRLRTHATGRAGVDEGGDPVRAAAADGRPRRDRADRPLSATAATAFTTFVYLRGRGTP